MGVPQVTIQLGPRGALMDRNVGKGFENAVQPGDMDITTCQNFAAPFGEDPKLVGEILSTSLGGIPLNFALYTVYRPATWTAGETYPVLTWGNGTCGQPELYGALLRYVASYGYVVVAANSRWADQGTPLPMLHALDFMAAANADPSSPYYRKLDMTKVGAMGHSRGAGATVTAGADARISDLIIFNLEDMAPKPYLAVSGDLDVTNFTASGMAMAIDASSEPAAYLYFHDAAGIGPLRGHLVVFTQPQRVAPATLAWWQMRLRKDATSRADFVGSSCGLCSMSTGFDYGEQGL